MSLAQLDAKRIASDAVPDFDEAYRLHAPDIERLIRRRVKDHALAEDLVQETFLRAFRAWGSIDPGRPLWPWLATIAGRVCIDAWRSQPGSRPVAGVDAAESVTSGQGDPVDAVIASGHADDVRRALLSLTAKDQRILVLKHVDGLRCEEIASLVGTTPATVRWSLSVARKRFRKRYLAATQETGFGSVLLTPGASTLPGDGDDAPVIVPAPGDVEAPEPVQEVTEPVDETSGYVTKPNEGVDHPEDARITSIVASPRSDGTVFAAGRNRECALSCPFVLFRSSDRGRTWTRLEPHGMPDEVVVLLLPPAYGAGHDRIFAKGTSGLLVSADGRTFAPAAVGLPPSDASMDISPAFNSGDPRIVMGSRHSLIEYRDDTKALSPAVYSTVGTEPVFASASLLMVGGLAFDPVLGWGSYVFRCESAICEPGVRLNNYPIAPKIKPDPGFAQNGVVYAFTDALLAGRPAGGPALHQQR